MFGLLLGDLGALLLFLPCQLCLLSLRLRLQLPLLLGSTLLGQRLLLFLNSSGLLSLCFRRSLSFCNPSLLSFACRFQR